MGNDYSGAMAGFGIGLFVIGLLIYLAVLALALWIGYLIMRTAVKNGVLLAMQQGGQAFPPAPYAGPGAPPQAPYAGPGASPYPGP